MRWLQGRLTRSRRENYRRLIGKVSRRYFHGDCTILEPQHIKEVIPGVIDELKIGFDMKRRIDAMSQYDMAQAWRFNVPGDPMFTGACFDYFKKVFEYKCGMTPDVSKKIGW